MELIDTRRNLEDYFQELLIGALKSQQVEIASSSCTYLVQLFGEFSRTERFHQVADKNAAGTPTLAELYERAHHGAPSAQLEAWRHLGDVALIVSSLFGRYVERRRSLVGVDYYIQMGSGAYNTAALYSYQSGLRSVFAELSRKFSSLVEVFTRIGEVANLPVSTSIERIYERWLASPGQEDLHKRLTQLGASPLLIGIGQA